MWNSYILSYYYIPESGFWEFLWALHNEHRIPVSRLLFWADLRFFGGRSLLLIPLNVIFMVATWAALCAAAHAITAPQRSLWLTTAAAAALPIWSWVQWFNVGSGFQGMFFLAYLLPLLAFLALANAVLRESTAWFLVAVFLGVASAGTMANGIATLPLMCIALVIMNQAPRRWIALTGLAAVIVLAGWFYGYHPISATPPRPSLVELIAFITAFFGSPFAAAIGTEVPDLRAGYIAGAIFFAGTLFVAIAGFRRRDPMFVGLLAFFAYLGLSCAGTAWGRAGLTGVSDMLRYATPAVISWSVLLVLVAALLQRQAQAVVGLAGLIIGATLLPNQMHVFRDEPYRREHRLMLAALALELKVPDVAILNLLYPVSNAEILNAMQIITERAERTGITMFADESFAKDVRRIGQPRDAGFHACEGAVERVEAIDGHSAHSRVTGWAFDRQAGASPKYVYLADQTQIVGVAVAGNPRPDIAADVGDRGKLSGFQGYTLGGPAPLSILCSE